jgi:hypothetical protein
MAVPATSTVSDEFVNVHKIYHGIQSGIAPSDPRVLFKYCCMSKISRSLYGKA